MWNELVVAKVLAKSHLANIWTFGRKDRESVDPRFFSSMCVGFVLASHEIL